MQHVKNVVFTEKNGDRRNVDNIIVLLTDGNPGDFPIAKRTANELKKNVKKVRKGIFFRFIRSMESGNCRFSVSFGQTNPVGYVFIFLR